MQVAILSSEAPGNACARVRLRDVMKYLEPEVDYTWTGILEAGSAEAAARCQTADVVVVQRAFPRASTMPLLQTVLFEGDKPVFYETDDLLTNLPASHPEFDAYARNRHLTLACIASSDAVIVSTEVLRARHLPLNARVHVFANTLDRPLWQHSLAPRRDAAAGQPLTIGFCGSHTHVPDLEAIAPALERIQADYGKRVRFSFFGCVPERLKQLSNLIYREGFVGYAEYPALLRSLDFDIGLAPLEHNEFNANKSHIKYLEYAACGIPGIYSDLAPYNASVDHRRTGLLARDTAEAWYNAIAQLIEQPKLAQDIATAAYQDIWTRFATETLAPDWLGMVQAILADCRKRPDAARRPPLARALWEQAVDYELRLAAQEISLAEAQKRIELLDHRPLERVLRKAKGLLFNRAYGES